MKVWQVAVVAVATAVVPAAYGQQYSGVSHPEQIPVTTTPDGIAQPVVYEGPAPVAVAPVQAAGPALKTRVLAPEPAVAAAREPVAAVPVGEAVPVRPVALAKLDTTERDDMVATKAEESGKAFLSERARAESDENVVTRVAGPSNQLPSGTLLKIRLRDELSTGKTKQGQEFRGELAYAVLRDGRVLLPAGSTVSGQVVEVHGGKRVSGAASMRLKPETVTLPDGTRYEIKAQLIDSELYRSTRVEEDGTMVRRDHTGRTLAVIGLTTGSSAAAGAVFGGWPGAVIGAGVGAGIATVMWLKKDRQTEMPVDTKLVFSLSAPLVVGGQ